MDELILKSLELSRVELLDIGLRGNTLLHFKHSAKTLEIVEERSQELYSILVEQSRSMVFSPVPSAVGDADDVEGDAFPLSEILEDKLGEGRYTDNKLQTKLKPDALDKRLLKISTEANTYYQEQGVDILYLALGFLEWFEDKNSSVPRKAPLVLIPVSLQRSTARERFKVSYTQADLGPNLSLGAKLKMDFRIDLPVFEEEFNLEDYLCAVERAILNEPLWKIVKDEIALGFFSFGKFQMYQDLDPNKWPEDKPIVNHPVLSGLFGNGLYVSNSSEGTVNGHSEHQIGDSSYDLVDLHFVKDADSSQTDAIIKVKSGSNLVIQGPPGTGKSQTITNIISESLADGKKVLFVAEKMAALEVVKRRLDECHLGDAVLELHSHKSNKKTVLEEIKRTLELGLPNIEDRSHDKKRHVQLREHLDEYCTQVNTPLLNSGLNYITALGHYLNLKNSASEYVLPVLDYSDIINWDLRAFNEACAQVQELVEQLAVMGTPSQSAFSTSTLRSLSPIEQKQLATLLQDALQLTDSAVQASSNLAIAMKFPSPDTLQAMDTLILAASVASQAPDLNGLDVPSDKWKKNAIQIKDLLDAGKALTALKARRADQLIDQAWTVDLVNARQVWVTTGSKWWKFISSDFRKAKRELEGLLRTPLPKEQAECVAIIDDVLSHQALNSKYDQTCALGEGLFGKQWRGLDSEWGSLSGKADWLKETHQRVSSKELPHELLGFLQEGKKLGYSEADLGKLKQASQQVQSKIIEVMQRLAVSIPEHQHTPVSQIPFGTISSALEKWSHRLDDLYQMTQYNGIVNTLRCNNLNELADLSFNWELPAETLLTTFKLAWYGGLVEHAFEEKEALKQFHRVKQESVIDEFKKLDSQLFHYAQESLVSKLFEGMPNSGSGAGEMAIIRKEINRKRRHLPIRKLISQAGRAIQQIKPVFMMSPMSVATYLEQGAVEFDLVVFDEASQVKVVDALGAILRGRQVVVVGDTRQMPPTDFFGRAVELDEEEAEESQTADIESILSMFLSKDVPEKMLRWHYRSRHDSLIAVSNQEFYDGKLMIFPSPGINAEAKGLKMHYLPDTTYDRGGSRTNIEEARHVAEAVIRHARTTPNLTLGVVAFSTAQRDAIILELERLRRNDPSTEAFFNNEALENFFVKNLENVQGDERDIIYISIGYGRMATGNVTGNFGPVNRDGGERRLNVLITRARLGMEVFSNFKADELKTTGTTPFGVRALKSFLKYAESGVLETRRETGKATDSPFEDQVISAIRALGYDVEPQVGSAGFFIDIAVRDPEKPGRYILAVECDGASYHSSSSARDRDRLRQAVLEGLGWRFHRIWSTDWFRNPHNETQRLKESIEFSIRYYQQLDQNSNITAAPKSGAPHKLKIDRHATVDTAAPAVPQYVSAGLTLGLPYWPELHELSLEELEGAMHKVVEVEAPIHIKEVAKRITESVGVSRVGQRIMSHIESVAAYGHRKGTFYVEGEFLYKNSEKKAEVRDRSYLQSSAKNVVLISDEEIAQALLMVVNMSFSIARRDAISETLSLMGFQKATSKASQRIEEVLDKLEREGKLQIREELVTL